MQQWHDFYKAVMQAGYRSARMISSQNNLLFAYTLYLMGRTEYRVDEFLLRQTIARWFFMTSLTGRYTSSPESKMEFDLARFREVKDAKSFARGLGVVCEETLTSDFWSITLPSELATSASRSPSLFAYHAALVLLDAKALFSRHGITEMLDPTRVSHRASLERHHLFPRSYLKGLGVEDLRETNQIANYALMEWIDNVSVSGQAPSEYLPAMIARFSSSELRDMHYWHALPDGWEGMDYTHFLIRRRELMAKVIADGYRRLIPTEGPPSGEPAAPIRVEEMVAGGETDAVEFKSTLRINRHTNDADPRIEYACLRTIVGFLNARGGRLVIGIADDGDPVGIHADRFANEDKAALHLVNLVRDRIGAHQMMYIHPHFDDYKEVRVLVVDCWPARSAVFVRDGQTEGFYVRSGPATAELTGSQMQEYIRQRFQ